MSTGSVFTNTMIDGVGLDYAKTWSGENRSAEEVNSKIVLPHSYSMYMHKTISRRVDVMYTPSPGNFTDLIGIASSALGGFGVPSSPLDENSLNKLTNKIWGDVKGGDFNAAVTASQLNQTFRMIGETATKIARSYSLGRKSDFPAAFSSLFGRSKAVHHKASDNWLELQYGWKPLMQDVRGGCEIVANHLNKPRSYQFTARNSVTVPVPDSNDTYRWNKTSCRFTERLTVRIHEVPTILDISGIEDPASVAWELTPYSFVVDWFIPVGDFLSAAAASRALTNATSIYTKTRSFKISGLAGKQWTDTSSQPPTVYQCTIVGDGGSHESFSIDRAVSTGVPVATPNIKPLSKSASVLHCLNAIALVTGLSKK